MRKTRVLVVDDEPETLKYVGANLRARDYDVVTAADGTEALKLADEDVFDLVLLDITMPGPDGFQVAQALRQRSAVPIIMLSATVYHIGRRESPIMTGALFLLAVFVAVGRARWA